jgi:lactate 2-monooxygenase
MTPPVEYATYQYELYFQGLAGTVPPVPVAYDRLESRAREVLDARAYGYVAGGAGNEATIAANRAALERWRLVPRMMRDVRARELSTTVLGTPLPAPVLLAPIGVQSIIHPDAEEATARGAASVGVPVVLSTAASRTIEQVAEAMGAVPRWYQLYWPDDRELAASFVARAEAAGYAAIVVTLDTKLLAWRPRDLDAAYLPFLHGEGIANYTSDPVFRAGLERPPEEDPQAAILRWAGLFSDKAVRWEDLAWLREQTALPIVVKGVQHPDDARLAADAGCDGIIVSNHGGRQVDGALGAADALPACRDAAGGMAVLFDSGIRGGADVVKALCLGADAVLLGRPYCWGLALAGADGVRHVIRCLLAEIDLTMAMCGVTAIAQLGPQLLQRADR